RLLGTLPQVLPQGSRVRAGACEGGARVHLRALQDRRGHRGPAAEEERSRSEQEIRSHRPRLLCVVPPPQGPRPGRVADGQSDRLRDQPAEGARTIPRRRQTPAEQQRLGARAPPPSRRKKELAVRRLRRWGPGQHRFRVPDRQLPDARPRAVGLPARPVPSLARLAPFPRARARPRLLEADPPERRSSAAARRKSAPSRSARLRSLISASRRAFYTPARDRVTTRLPERVRACLQPGGFRCRFNEAVARSRRSARNALVRTHTG